MALPSPKELLKLANACRKAGIKSFKSGELEFTLTDEAPASPYIKAKELKSKANETLDQMVAANDPFATDSPTPEQLLYWSVGVNEQAGQETKGE